LQESRPVGAARISIGTETRYPGLEDCSVVAHPFGTAEWMAHLTVLGPMRMNYPHVLHLVGQGAQMLTDQLRDRLQQAAAGPGQP
jgi:transcriptional regulator of heat shock response